MILFEPIHMQLLSDSPNKLQWWEWLLILLVSLVFGYAGITKIQAAADFSHAIARFDVLPSFLINPVALTLPVIETLLAVTLLLPFLQRPALLGTLLCCLLFAMILLSAIVRGIPVSCSCFGLLEKPSLHAAWWALGRDLVLILVAGCLYLRRIC